MSRIEEIVEIASRNNGRYLLPQRFSRIQIGMEPLPDDAERAWEACKSLVEEGKARWLRKTETNMAPGIEMVRTQPI